MSVKITQVTRQVVAATNVFRVRVQMPGLQGIPGPTGPAGATGPTGPAGPQPPLGSAAPVVDGVAAAGTASSASHEDHVHPTDTSRLAASAVGTAAAKNVPATGDAALGEVVLGSDTRLTDARTPTAHATSHAAAGSDPLTLSESQVTGLVTDLAAKAPLASPVFTGNPTVPTAPVGDNDLSAANTAFVTAADVAQAAITATLKDVSETQLVQFTAADSVLSNLPSRIHPAEQLLKQAVLWLDAAHSSASGQTVTNLGWGGSALNATMGSTGGADSNDPKFLDWTGTNYVYLPGVGGNYLSVPNETALNITGDIDVRALIAFDDWTPSAYQVFLAKQDGGSTNNSWMWFLNPTTGYLTFQWSTDGANGLSATSSAAPAVVDGAALWVRAVLDVDNGASGRDVKFYTSLDGTTWTLLGTTQTAAGVTSIYASTKPVYVGAQGSASTYMTSGKIYRAQVLNGINGTPVLDIDTSLVTSGSNTSFPALTGQTVTVNRSASGRKTACVTHPVWLFGTDDYMEVADNDLIDFAATDSFTVMAVVRQWATPTSYGRYINKGGIGNGPNYVLSTFGTASSAYGHIGDGSASAIRQGLSTIAAGAVTGVGMVVDRTAQTIATFAGSTLSATASTSTVGSPTNASPLRVGNVGSSTYQDFELVAVAIFRRALSASEIVTLSNYFAGRVN